MNKNEYDSLEESYTATSLENQDSNESLVLIKDIYVSRDDEGKHPPRYYATNDALLYSLKMVEKKYNVEQLRKFHDDVRKKNLLGKRRSWHINAPLEDLDKFYGKPEPEGSKGPIETINDLDPSGKYLHIIYAPLMSEILKQKPMEKIVHLTKLMVDKFGPKAIEILMDYSIFHKLIPRQEAWSNLSVEDDIKKAIQWSVEHTDDYLKIALKQEKGLP